MVKSIPLSGMGDVYLYEVLYAYHPKKGDSGDIPIDPGDEIQVAAKDVPSSQTKDPSWVFGYNVTKKIKGLFPSNYVKRVQLVPSKPTVPPKPSLLRSPSSDQYMDLGNFVSENNAGTVSESVAAMSAHGTLTQTASHV